jgi:hypothetical protein
VSEPFVGCLDLYYPRTAGLSLDMETFPYVRDLTWLPDGCMEIVPLFEFVYHEYGPVAAQGIYPAYPWGLSEADDYCTWAEARSVLWGGLITSFPIPDQPAPAAQRAKFLRSLVAARTDYARDFLAYGKMQRPPTVACGTIDINHGLGDGGWLRKARSAGIEAALGAPLSSAEDPLNGKRDSHALSVEQWAKSVLAAPATPARTAALRVPSVMCQAYTLEDDQLGILLVNLRTDVEEVVRVPLDPPGYGLAAGTYEIRQVGMKGADRVGTYPDQREAALQLPPREVVLLTATRLRE